MYHKQGGEVLQKNGKGSNFELLVYTRRKVHQQEKDLTITPTQTQSKTPGNGHLKIPGIPTHINSRVFIYRTS